MCWIPKQKKRNLLGGENEKEKQGVNLSVNRGVGCRDVIRLWNGWQHKKCGGKGV
jgi:hypothetical protein